MHACADGCVTDWLTGLGLAAGPWACPCVWCLAWPLAAIVTGDDGGALWGGGSERACGCEYLVLPQYFAMLRETCPPSFRACQYHCSTTGVPARPAGGLEIPAGACGLARPQGSWAATRWCAQVLHSPSPGRPRCGSGRRRWWPLTHLPNPKTADPMRSGRSHNSLHHRVEVHENSRYLAGPALETGTLPHQRAPVSRLTTGPASWSSSPRLTSPRLAFISARSQPG